MQRFLAAAALSGLLAAVGGTARASAVFVGSGSNSVSGNPISASANFSISGNQLTITLANTNIALAAGGKYVQTDVLCGLFFDVTGNPILTYTSATASTLRTGTSVTTSPPSALDVKTEWVYKRDTSGLAPSVPQHYGLGTAGYGIFPTPGGQQFNYGIMGSNFDGTNGNNPVNGGTFAQTSITYKFTFTGSLSEDAFSNVRFQYGTALDEPSLPGVSTAPEPSSLALLGVGGLVCLGLARRKRQES